MPVQTLTYQVIDLLEAAILERGVNGLQYELVADARIKTEDNELGVGPVVYRGRTEDPETDTYSGDGVIRDALFLFVDEEDCLKSLVSNMDPTDLADTMADFMDTHGGSVADMKAKRPNV
ncbi:MAG: hypothetical protein ACLFRG_22155 [Desulfococcaceae bacterium]